ncbi:carboxypeptidase regulatory-like domain-containing protein [Actinoplanes sp. NPDC051861]|uniref:carboxypeptidase regulatory-like domain-containing protein n=1 Tax=Actinoplanes sp. NPDC051861 TaxID=3155170 RepID=UPI00341C5CFE
MTLELRRLRAALILDAEDAYAREQRTAGPHPRPLGRLAYHVITGGRPVPLTVIRNPSGYHLCYRLHLPPGDYTLRTEGEHYQPVEQPLTLPATAPVRVDLWPGVTYPFAGAAPPGRRRLALLRGGVVTGAARAPVRGATVSVAGWPRTYVTGRDGQWVIPGPPGATAADVTATLPGGATQTRTGVPIRTDRDSTTVDQFRF